MSQQNSNNDNVEYDDLSNGSSISGFGMEDLIDGSSVSGLNSQQDAQTMADTAGDAQTEQDAMMFNDVDAQVPAFDPTPKEIVYRKPRFDLFAMMLLISWFALLGAIAIMWFECDPTEYGDPPYKESSVPVVRTAG